MSRLVTLHPPDWTFDPDELRRAFSSRTKAIIVNSPNNPTGRVFQRHELAHIAKLAEEFDTLTVADEEHPEHILYDGAEHIHGNTARYARPHHHRKQHEQKTYSVTGWRVGWVMAPADIAEGIRKVHDFLTVGAAAPLQQAGAVTLHAADILCQAGSTYTKKRDIILAQLNAAGVQETSHKAPTT